MTVVITFIMLIFSILMIFYNSRSIERDLHNQLTKLITLSQKNLGIPLWQYNYDYIEDYLESLFLYEDLVFANVKNYEKELSKKKNSEFQELSYEKFRASSKFIVAETEIIYKNKIVGKVQLVLSRKRVNNLLIFSSSLAIFLLLIINAAVFGTNFLLSKRYLFKPLSKFEATVRRIADGDLDASLDISSKDEIGQLAKSFKQMMENLRKITASRDELNSEIQKRINTESALRQEKDRVQNYLDIAGVMMLAIDKNHKVTLINKRGCEILGLPEDQVLGKDWFKTFIPENVQSMVK
jgi:nitrogen fixation/metabolism regulation signal transduction histidine kinase